MKPQKWEQLDAPSESDEGSACSLVGGGATGGSGGSVDRATEVLLILKWGGSLTPLGQAQAELLGTNFRKLMYPENSGGMLRLHATYRHDLKINSSDEGRVMKTGMGH